MKARGMAMSLQSKYKTKQRELLIAYLETVPGVDIAAGDACEYFKQEGVQIAHATV